MVTNLDAHSALDHQVELLAGMGGGVNGLILQFLGILVGDPVGGCQLLAEHGGHILNGDAVLTGGYQTLALAGNGVYACNFYAEKFFNRQLDFRLVRVVLYDERVLYQQQQLFCYLSIDPC